MRKYILFILLICFIWFFNLKPLWINKELNVTENLAETGRCEMALNKNERILSMGSTFLDAYVRVKYFDNIRRCEKEITVPIVKKSIKLLEEAVQSWPYYTRCWMFLGQFADWSLRNTSLSLKEKNELIEKSREYFKRVRELSPKR